MKRLLIVSFSVLMALGVFLVSGCGGEPEPPSKEDLPFYQEDPVYDFSVEEARTLDSSSGKYVWSDELVSMLNPFWLGNVVYNETVMLVDDGESISGKLLFTPKKILSVRDYAWDVEFTEGEDFTVEGNTIVRTENSDIPYLTEANLTGQELPEGYQVVSSIANVETDVVRMGATIYTEGSLIYGHQVSVSYVYDPAEAELGDFKAFDAAELPALKAKLAAGEDVRLGIIGDSVAEGCSSSSMFNREPYLPNFIDLTALALNAGYRAAGKTGEVTVGNYALGGMTSEWGAAQAQVDEIIADAPDVLFIHFGINDNGSDFSGMAYGDNIESLVLRVKAALPEAEIVLIKAFTPEIMSYDGELFEDYWAQLDRIAENAGVWTLDLYTQSLSMLNTKKYMDVTGNGINHLNDYTSRLYAMNILSMLNDYEA